MDCKLIDQILLWSNTLQRYMSQPGVVFWSICIEYLLTDFSQWAFTCSKWATMLSSVVLMLLLLNFSIPLPKRELYSSRKIGYYFNYQTENDVFF